jgi:pimeloyl-ACP methyl ester carboxylesterase
MPPPSFTVFIPGFLGSCLEYPGIPIWTECFHDNYMLLANQSAVLNYQRLNPAKPTRILSYGYIRSWYPFGHFTVCKDLLDWLRALPVVEFAYDWRASLIDTAVTLGKFLSTNLGIDVKESGSSRFTLITHSMGGLVARIALVAGEIHHENIEKLIHIAPPLKGSAGAFSNLYGSVDLPLINQFLWVSWHGWTNGRRALRNLQAALRTFPSMYQLLPPSGENFLRDHRGTAFNPLDPGRPVIPVGFKAEAEYAQDMLRQSITDLEKWNIPRSIIFGSNGNNSTHDSFNIRVVNNEYEPVKPIPLLRADGDNRVTVRSATYDGLDPNCDARPILAATHMTMCDDNRVLGILKTI